MAPVAQLKYKLIKRYLQKMFNTDEEAHEEVKRGRAWGSIVFQSNYSESLVERVEGGRYASDYTIEASDVDVRLDMSSKTKMPFNPPLK